MSRTPLSEEVKRARAEAATERKALRAEFLRKRAEERVEAARVAAIAKAAAKAEKAEARAIAKAAAKANAGKRGRPKLPVSVLIERHAVAIAELLNCTVKITGTGKPVFLNKE